VWTGFKKRVIFGFAALLAAIASEMFTGIGSTGER